MSAAQLVKRAREMAERGGLPILMDDAEIERRIRHALGVLGPEEEEAIVYEVARHLRLEHRLTP